MIAGAAAWSNVVLVGMILFGIAAIIFASKYKDQGGT